MSIAPLLALKDGWKSSSQIIQMPIIMPVYYHIPSPMEMDGIYKRKMELSSQEDSSFWEKKGLGDT